MDNSTRTDGAAGAPDGKVRIFLSYKMEDEDRANLLETTLLAAGQGRIDVFRARQIPFGQDWKNKIKEKIADSHLLLLLYTDPVTKDWGWCLFECGMFLRNEDVNSRLICLHHPKVQPPEPVRDLKSVKATKENARELLKDLLLHYPQEHGMRPINLDLFVDSQQLELYCGNIVRAAGEATAQYYGHDARMEMNVRPEDVVVAGESFGRETYDVGSEVCVELSLPLAACLDFDRTCITWGMLRQSSINDYRWLDALARVIYRFVHQGEASLRDEAMLEMFRSGRDSRLYRPYLHQIEKGADGRVRFHVYFMEESSLDYRSLPHELGMLFTGLTLGTRFRYELLKRYHGKVRAEVLRTQDCGRVVRGIWHHIAKIEQESTARGINNPDLFPFAYAKHEEEICDMFKEWDGTLRPRLVEITTACETCGSKQKKRNNMRCERLKEMEQVLDSLSDMNGRFMVRTSSCIDTMISEEARRISTSPIYSPGNNVH